MADQQRPHSSATVYQIRVKGQLSGAWAEWFGGLAMTVTASGDTLLTGALRNQAALHGVLRSVRDLGLPLISIIPVDPTADATPPIV